MINKLPKRLFHGTTTNYLPSLQKGINVNIEGANQSPDFGIGFYLTSQMYQAEKQAIRKTNQYNKPRSNVKSGYNDLVHPIVLEYELSLNEEQLENNCKIFDKPDIDWGNFIVNNRTNTKLMGLHNIEQNIPLVFGPLADGQPNIGVLLYEYKKGIITREELIQGIRPSYNGNNFQDQLSVHTKTAADWLVLKGVKAVR